MTQLHFEDVTISMISLNEEIAVEKVVAEINEHLPGCSVVLVDSSTDRTAEIAESLGASVIKQMPPIGYGPAMMLALKSAETKYVFTIDCDGTYPIADLKSLIGETKAGDFDLADGNRLPKKPRNMALINYIGNKTFSVIASTLFFRHFPDLHSGMRGYKRELIDLLDVVDSKHDALPVSLLLVPVALGKRLLISDIGYDIRLGDSKMHAFKTVFWTVARIVNARFFRR